MHYVACHARIRSLAASEGVRLDSAAAPACQSGSPKLRSQCRARQAPYLLVARFMGTLSGRREIGIAANDQRCNKTHKRGNTMPDPALHLMAVRKLQTIRFSYLERSINKNEALRFGPRSARHRSSYIGISIDGTCATGTSAKNKAVKTLNLSIEA